MFFFECLVVIGFSFLTSVYCVVMEKIKLHNTWSTFLFIPYAITGCLLILKRFNGEENALGFIAVKFVIFVVSGIVFFVMPIRKSARNLTLLPTW